MYLRDGSAQTCCQDEAEAESTLLFHPNTVLLTPGPPVLTLIEPGVWQVCHKSALFLLLLFWGFLYVTGMTLSEKTGIGFLSPALEVDALPTRTPEP